MSAFSLGNTYDTFDSKTWVVVYSVTSANPALAIGPYDGSTTPSA